MKIPSYKSIIPAAMIAMSYFADPDFSYSQTQRDSTQRPEAVQAQKTDTTKKTSKVRYVQNRISLQDSDHCYSATGEGIFLKNFCYNRTLTPNSEFNLEEVFKAVDGKVYHGVVDARR